MLTSINYDVKFYDVFFLYFRGITASGVHAIHDSSASPTCHVIYKQRYLVWHLIGTNWLKFMYIFVWEQLRFSSLYKDIDCLLPSSVLLTEINSNGEYTGIMHSILIFSYQNMFLEITIIDTFHEVHLIIFWITKLCNCTITWSASSS